MKKKQILAIIVGGASIFTISLPMLLKAAEVDYDVPYIQQRNYDGIGESACAPTSLAMLLNYEYPASNIDVQEIYHAGLQNYLYQGPSIGYRNLSWGSGYTDDPGNDAIPENFDIYYHHCLDAEICTEEGDSGGRGLSYIQNYLDRIWDVSSQVLNTIDDVYTALGNGPILGHVWAHGNNTWGHYLVIRGYDDADTPEDRTDDTIILNDPYDAWSSSWDTGGEDKRVLYNDFFVRGRYGVAWFRDALAITPMDTETQRENTVVVDTGHNAVSGNSNSHTFQVDDPYSVNSEGEYIWQFFYGEEGDWFYPVEGGHAARWAPKLSIAGNYEISVKYLADNQSGEVTYTVYDNTETKLLQTTINQYKATSQWASGTISSDIYLPIGSYVRASNISANTNIDAVKFKYLNSDINADGPIIMEGNFIKTAISQDGTLGFGGNTSPGILHDPTGQKIFGLDDYLTPGSPWELFSVRTNQTGLVSNNNNYGGEDGDITTVSLNDLSHEGDFDHYVTWSGQYFDYFSILNEYHFNDNDEKVDIVSKITALQDLTDLKFLRSIDPDPDVYTYGIWDTDNRQGFDVNNDGDYNDLADIAPENWVHAEGKYTGLTIGLYSTASYYHNTGVSSWWSDDPDFFLAGQNDGDWDYTIGLAFEFGDLRAGESVTFNYAYVMGELVEVADIPWVPSKIYESPTQPDIGDSIYVAPSSTDGFIKRMTGFYGLVEDFTKSVTGVVEVFVDPISSLFDKLMMKTGSPAWGVFKLELLEPVNYVTFNFTFISDAGGLLKVFFDGEEIFVADERILNQGEVYGAAINLPDTPSGVHTLSYRLDSFDDIQSIIEISEIQTGTLEKIVYPTGDFNQDTIVDRLDINVINTYRNQPASVYPECDIDGDGTITIYDARKLMRMCTYPRCASN